MIELQDMGVLFNEEQHTYTLDNKTLQGITSTLVAYALPEHAKQIEYLKQTKGDILNAKAEYGHKMHKAIEDHMNGKKLSLFDDEEKHVVKRYKALIKGLKPVASEYTVTDSTNFASNIDQVLIDKHGNIILDDHKFTYSFNEEYTSWQLSIYAYLFELCNPKLIVSRLVVSYLSKQDMSKDALIDVPRHSAQEINDLIFAYLTNTEFVGKKATELRAEQSGLVIAEDMQKAIKDTLIAIKEQEQKLNDFKSQLKAQMEANDLYSIETDYFKVTLSKEGKTNSFDKKKFEEENKELYQQYMVEKTTPRKLLITIK